MQNVRRPGVGYFTSPQPPSKCECNSQCKKYEEMMLEEAMQRGGGLCACGSCELKFVYLSSG